MTDKKQIKRAQFKDDERKINSGVVFFVSFLVVILVIASFGVYMSKMANGEIKPKPFAYSRVLKQNKNALTLNVVKQNAHESITNFTSEDLARVFYQYTKNARLENNQIFINHALWTFVGDGFCKEQGRCMVVVDINGYEPPNEKGKDMLILPLYNNEGLVNIEKED